MLGIVVAVLVVVLDQLTKWLVSSRLEMFAEHPVIAGFFSFQYVRNPGAAFGMLHNQRWFFVAVALAAVGGMLYYLRQPEGKKGLVPWALGLLMGGALGNMIDRVLYGEVVDFFLFYWKDYLFPNFNVADIAINVGVGLFIIHLFLDGREARREGV
ncbi:MAG TPA: signal peptidase II [Symbiobacteriaceae bacterium]|nr:signal peptidase II [Symbiobacteriaceae bacterium]